VPRVRIDLGHVGIVRTLIAHLPGALEDEVFPLLQAKDAPGLARLLAAAPDGPARRAVLALPGLFGPVPGVLAKARAVLPASPALADALAQLERLATARQLAGGDGLEVEIALDLGEARGYRYHSGAIFAAYVDGLPNAIGRGGRYDNVGAAFGRSRPATGFSLELRELAGLTPERPPAAAVRAPWGTDPGLADAVRALRAAGEIVVQVLPGHEHEQQEFECDRELAKEGADWAVRPLRGDH
jgi:ATP phosphoribosyltransferase regulatory subunit